MIINQEKYLQHLQPTAQYLRKEQNLTAIKLLTRCKQEQIRPPHLKNLSENIYGMQKKKTQTIPCVDNFGVTLIQRVYVAYTYINLVSQCMFGMNSETTELILIKFCNYL
jgi:hypothetical protein